MISKAVFLSPLRITAGTMMKVTFLRTHNTGIALGQLSKTGVAIALTKTFFRAAPTMDAVNITSILYGNFFTYQCIHTNAQVIYWKLVVNPSLCV
jgi:hypothetical protein